MSHVRLTWNVLFDARQLLSFHFMLNALRAGTVVAVVAGALGYFMVLRRQSFAGHTLAVIGFPGAAGATWLGVNVGLGYFAFCLAGALLIAALSAAGRDTSGVGGSGQESAVIGTIQAFALACGFLFISLYKGFLSGVNSLLFGSLTGVSDDQVLVLTVSGAGCLIILAVIARPLLFTTIDPAVAQARGVPVRAVSALFLVLLGLGTAGTSQVTGSLLVFALLVAPAAAATRLTARPVLGVGLSIILAVAVTWAGEGIAFFSPYPIGFWVSSLAFAAFVMATGYRATADALSRRGPQRAPFARTAKAP